MDDRRDYRRSAESTAPTEARMPSPPAGGRGPDARETAPVATLAAVYRCAYP